MEPSLRPCIVLDIDNTLVDHSTGWLDYVRKRVGKNFVSCQEAKGSLGEDYKFLKEEYRSGGYKLALQLTDSRIPRMLQDMKLVRKDLEIAILSSRPVAMNSLVKFDTLVWLAVQGIPCDRIYFSPDKSAVLERLFPFGYHCFVFEDEIGMVKDFLKLGFVDVFFVSDPWTEASPHPRLFPIRSVVEGLEVVQALMESNIERRKES